MSIYDRQLSLSGGVLHHIGLLLQQDEGRRSKVESQPRVRCAWCDAEAGVALRPGQPLVSHTICLRHLEQMKAEMRRIAA